MSNGRGYRRHDAWRRIVVHPRRNGAAAVAGEDAGVEVADVVLVLGSISEAPDAQMGVVGREFAA